ncbi:hypothetical protein S7711_06153 [Stachybotrys chartarum IBT 7711]|uniref:Carboxylic ester hydrolase n=1 Tax=Stachybotrys chartarum (strain CBS 109288 / IBT 7711) TaxID=1280523 RepID=A0A084B6A4_STACB|nr:hypothetical protein S7711_06153 [Stachybotrys chartarum IBT 7711]
MRTSLALVGLVARGVVATYAEQELNNRAGISILSTNNLDQTATGGATALLVHEALTYHEANLQCDSLSETLWVYNADNFADGLQSALAHQVYIRDYTPNDLFWVSGGPETCGCSAIDPDGQVRKVNCKDKLPALCTQSAPLSNINFEDTSAKFQINQTAGDLTLTGYRDRFAWKFLGVRYAPVTERFEYSEPFRGASGHAWALEHGAPCPQPNNGVVRGGQSEDCLFLSIWTPHLPSTEGPSKLALKPVIFYIHGGGFREGAALNADSDGTNIASRADAVVVSINYRLGALGYIAFNDGIHNGNAALGDQISALTWVSENIASFGGDPERITLMGESAGAVSNRWLMTSPLAEGLFKQAIMHSDGTGANMNNFEPPEVSYSASTLSLLNDAGCSGAEDAIACLRNMDAMDIIGLPTQITRLVRDGKYIVTPNTPSNGTLPGFARNVRIMTGGTAEEGGVFMGSMNWDWPSIDEWAAAIRERGRDPTPAVENPEAFDLDPENPTPFQFRVAAALMAGMPIFTCGIRSHVYSASLHNAHEAIYHFIYNRTYSEPEFTNEWCSAQITEEYPHGDPSLPYLRCHGGDQVPSWGNVYRAGMPERDSLDAAYTRLILDYKAAFVWTGNPNPDHEYLRVRGYDSTLERVLAAGTWEEFDSKKKEAMILAWDGGMAPLDTDPIGTKGN